MKVKNLLTAALTALVLTACTKNQNGQGTDPEGQPSKVSITVSVGDPELKAVQFPGNAPTTEEKAIRNITIFVFNNQKMLEHIETQSYSGETQNSYKFDFEVKTGRHYFFAVANVPTTEYNYPIGEVLMDHFAEEILDYNLRILTGQNDERDVDITRGFLMTNKNGAVEKVIETVENADLNTVSIQLGRAVTKVAVAFDPTQSGQPDGKLEKVSFKVTNNPSRMYAMPKYAGEVLLTPNYYDEQVIASHYQNPLDDFQSVITSATAVADRTFTYCMENSNFEPKQGNATMVLIRGQFVPDPTKLLNPDGTPGGTLAADTTFYRITMANTDKFFEAGYYAGVPEASLYDAATQKVVSYQQGWCYYPVWLENENSGNEDPYTVKRNSFYKITITSVAGAGTPDENGSIDPEEPLNKTAPIDATIYVVDWDEISSSIGI